MQLKTESQFGKHHKSLSEVTTTHTPRPSNLSSQISKEIVVNIAASITTEQKEKEKRHCT